MLLEYCPLNLSCRPCSAKAYSLDAADYTAVVNANEKPPPELFETGNDSHDIVVQLLWEVRIPAFTGWEGDGCFEFAAVVFASEIGFLALLDFLQVGQAGSGVLQAEPALLRDIAYFEFDVVAVRCGFVFFEIEAMPEASELIDQLQVAPVCLIDFLLRMVNFNVRFEAGIGDGFMTI